MYTSSLNQSITCTEMVYFIGILNQKTFFSTKITSSLQTLGHVEVFIQNNHIPNTSRLDGIELLNVSWLMAIMDTKWTCGEQDALYLRSSLYFLCFQEMMKLIKCIESTRFLGLQPKNCWTTFRNMQHTWSLTFQLLKGQVLSILFLKLAQR